MFKQNNKDFLYNNTLIAPIVLQIVFIINIDKH